MNKREVQKAVKEAEPVKVSFPLGGIEDLLEKYEEVREALQDKVDRIEEMDEIGPATQDRFECLPRLQAA